MEWGFAEKYWAEKIIGLAVAEDVGRGDITTRVTIPQNRQGEGKIVFRQEGILAGLPVVEQVYKTIDAQIIVSALQQEGTKLFSGDVVALIKGPAWAVLTGERIALNFLQHLSGVATTTYQMSNLLAGCDCQVVDTRKTTPGMRVMEKYAVRIGGGRNHRMGLDDGVLIKDNHIIAAGGIKAAVAQAKKHAPYPIRVEVEVETKEQVQEALQAGAHIIMLDNMELCLMEQMVRLIDGRAIVEASGGITKDKIMAVAKTGVDYISVGAITHSSVSLDISLDLALTEKV